MSKTAPRKQITRLYDVLNKDEPLLYKIYTSEIGNEHGDVQQPVKKKVVKKLTQPGNNKVCINK